MIWIERTVWEEQQARRKRHEDLQQWIMRTLWERYGPQWVKMFSAMRTKKAQWEELQRLGLHPAELSTYYRHGARYDYYLRSKHYVGKVPVILDRLGVVDPEILAALGTLSDM